jgi:hypothetical protein
MINLKAKICTQEVLLGIVLPGIILNILVHSCQSLDKKIEDSGIKSIIEQTHSLQLSQFSDSASFLFLENASNSMVAEINKIKESENYLFILDKEILETLFVFDKNGFFRFKIETGPGAENEPTSIHDFTIDEKEREIIILDRAKQKLFLFDFDNNYIKTIPINTFADFIEIFDNGLILLFRNIYFQKGDAFGNHQVLFMDKEGRIIKQLLQLSKGQTYQAFYESLNPLAKSNNKIVFQPALSNHVYEFSQDGGYIKTRFELGVKDILPKIKEIKAIEEFMREIDKENILYSVGLIFSTEKMHIMLYRNRDRYFFVTHRRNDNNIYAYPNIDNNLNEIQFIQPVSQDENWIYFSTPPEILTNLALRSPEAMPNIIVKSLGMDRIISGDVNPLIIKLKINN